MIARFKNPKRPSSAFHTVFLDMDGVLVNWSGGVFDYLNIDIKDEFNRKLMKDDVPFEKHFFEGGRDEFVSLINEAGYDFWYNLELLPWAKDLIKLVNKLAGEYNVYFLTSHSDFPSSLQAKVDYVSKHFNSDRIVVTKYKSLCAKQNVLLIDDMDYNIAPFVAEGGSAYKWPNQWKLIDKEIDVEEHLANLKNIIEGKSNSASDLLKLV